MYHDLIKQKKDLSSSLGRHIETAKAREWPTEKLEEMLSDINAIKLTDMKAAREKLKECQLVINEIEDVGMHIDDVDQHAFYSLLDYKKDIVVTRCMREQIMTGRFSTKMIGFYNSLCDIARESKRPKEDVYKVISVMNNFKLNFGDL